MLAMDDPSIEARFGADVRTVAGRVVSEQDHFEAGLDGQRAKDGPEARQQVDVVLEDDRVVEMIALHPPVDLQMAQPAGDLSERETPAQERLRLERDLSQELADGLLGQISSVDGRVNSP